MREFLEKMARAHAQNPGLSAEDLAHQMAHTSSGSKAAGYPEDLNLIDVALDRAALVAAFEPETLIANLPHMPDTTSSEAVRSALLRNSLPLKHSDLRIIRTTQRHLRLEALDRSERFALELQETEHVGATISKIGPAGQHKILRRILSVMATHGRRAAFDALEASPHLSIDELRMRLQVLNWIIPEHTDDFDFNLDLARKRMQFRQLISTMENREKMRVEAERFIGRQPLLETLTKRLFTERQSPTVPIVALHGMGGIGKSAILAALTNHLWHLKPNLLVVRLDFDRPGFGTAKTDFLTLQIVDQLAAQAGFTDTKTLSGSEFYSRGSSLETISENTDSAVSQFDIIRRETGLDRPVLLILDTLEERQRHGPSEMSQLSFWLEQMVFAPGGENLAILVAGRARPDVNDFYFPDYIDQPIDELKTREREALLVSLGITKKDAGLLAPLSGNPLFLHLVSRLVLRESGPTAAQLAGDGIDPSAGAEVLQGMIYDRVLGHVEDPSARKLAYPGLVLREVTPQIIADVIAPVVLDTELDAPLDAQSLFAALRREVWLVEYYGPDRVRHRADVRRLMMTYLSKDKTVKAAAQAIHERAIAHFHRSGNTPEASYHQAMIADPNTIQDLPPTTARQWLQDIGGDIDFIPDAVAAALRATAGDRLSDREIALLPDRLWSRVTEDLGPQLVEEDDLRRARHLWANKLGIRQPQWVLEARLGFGDTPAVREIFDSLDDISDPDRKSLFVRVAMRNSDWRQAFESSCDVLALAKDFSSSNTAMVKQSGRTTREITQLLQLISYNVISAAKLDSKRSDTEIEDQETRRWGALKDNLQFVDRSLIHGHIETARLDRSSLTQLEELHRIRTLFLHCHRGSLRFNVPGCSRFQFMPSVHWIDTAHAAAREAREHLGSWGSLSRQVAKAAEGEGHLRISDVTQEMASDAVSAITRLPPPFQRMPVFSGTGYREHRQPLRYALADVVVGSETRLANVVDALRQLCRASGCIIPIELSKPQIRIAGSVESVEFLLVPLLHYADQCGLMNEFCDALADLFPHAEKLNYLVEDLRRWSSVLPPPDISGHANRPIL